jgi:hypothetical protein
MVGSSLASSRKANEIQRAQMRRRLVAAGCFSEATRATMRAYPVNESPRGLGGPQLNAPTDRRSVVGSDATALASRYRAKSVRRTRHFVHRLRAGRTTAAGPRPHAGSGTRTPTRESHSHAQQRSAGLGGERAGAGDALPFFRHTTSDGDGLFVVTRRGGQPPRERVRTQPRRTRRSGALTNTRMKQ